MSKFRLSVDDGCASDIRLAELAKKYEIETIFYWPIEHRSLAYENGYKPLTIEQQMLIAENFAVGSHTLTHRHLTKLIDVEVIREVYDSRLLLQGTFSQPIDSFCFPRGYSNEFIDTIVYKIYKTARRTKGLDDEGYKLVHVHPNSGANNNLPWQNCIAEKTHLWMHTHELNKFSLWGELEDVLKEGN